MHFSDHMTARLLKTASKCRRGTESQALPSKSRMPASQSTGPALGKSTRLQATAGMHRSYFQPGIGHTPSSWSRSACLLHLDCTHIWQSYNITISECSSHVPEGLLLNRKCAQRQARLRKHTKARSVQYTWKLHGSYAFPTLTGPVRLQHLKARFWPFSCQIGNILKPFLRVECPGSVPNTDLQ